MNSFDFHAHVCKIPLMSDDTKAEKIDPTDILVGKRIRFYRKLKGLTQEQLSAEIGISFQQFQKYESGKAKIYASRLYHIASFLETDISEFFEEDKTAEGMSDNEQDGFSYKALDNDQSPAALRAFLSIKDKEKRKAVIEMMKAMA